MVPQPRRRHKTVISGLAECFEKMDPAGAELERGLESLPYALAGTDGRPESRLRTPAENQKERSMVDWGPAPGPAPKPPRFNAFAPGFLDREASCARHLGIPAPESALRLRLRRALSSAQPGTAPLALSRGY